MELKKGVLASQNPINISIDKLPQRDNDNLPLVWADVLNFALRGDQELATLRFYAVFPEATVEQARIQVSVAHIKKMIDILASATGHYPTKPSEKKMPPA